MELEEFSEKIRMLSSKINVEINENEIENLYKYMHIMLEWNENINLTAITEPDEIILKHYIDSFTIEKYIKDGKKVIDVGTGAGFPGVPVGIIRENVDILLMDSLNKRIKFLDEVINKLEMKNMQTIHGRAEELAQNTNYREKYDYATSRAVASLNVLLEYMLPFVKIGGYCICMKGSNLDEEIENSKNAISILGGQLEKVDNIVLPDSDIGRNIVVIKKVKETPRKYPRKAGTPTKEPIV